MCYLEREKTSVGADIGQKFSNFVSVNEDDREGHEDWSATPEQKVDDKSDSVFLVHVLGRWQDEGSEKKIMEQGSQTQFYTRFTFRWKNVL